MRKFPVGRVEDLEDQTANIVDWAVRIRNVYLAPEVYHENGDQTWRDQQIQAMQKNAEKLIIELKALQTTLDEK